jgi:hypothetical protein
MSNMEKTESSIKSFPSQIGGMEWPLNFKQHPSLTVSSRPPLPILCSQEFLKLILLKMSFLWAFEVVKALPPNSSDFASLWFKEAISLFPNSQDSELVIKITHGLREVHLAAV